jgi:HEPN domain-containing protein
MSLGGKDYLEAVQLRLDEANQLYDSERWVGSVYLAGRAVECLLRCLLWSPTTTMEVGHDLIDALDRIRRNRLLSDELLDQVTNCASDITVVWQNNLRYTGPKRFNRMLEQCKRNRIIGSMKVKGSAAKANAKHVLEKASTIVHLGVPVCEVRLSRS